MVEAAEVASELTENKKYGDIGPANDHQSANPDTEGEHVEGNHAEPTSSNGSKVEKAQTAKETAKEEEKSKPSRIKEIWGKFGLDIGTVMMMFKWVLPTEYVRS